CVRLLLPRPPTSTLFPYTTLFRSCMSKRGDRRPGPLLNDSAPYPVFNLILHTRKSEFIIARISCCRKREVLIKRHSGGRIIPIRSEEHTSELQSRENLVCRLLLEK